MEQLLDMEVTSVSKVPEKLLEEIGGVLTWPATHDQVVAASKLVPDEIVQMITASGTAEECREQVRAYVDAGCTCPILYPLGPDVQAGLDAFARAVAHSLEGSGAHLHVVRPGFVHTKMTAGLRPAPFAVDPRTVAAAVLRGIERDQPVIWVPSTLRWVFLALRALPQQLWRRLPG